MKKINLSIQSPCSENWNTFTPNSQGRHCSKCDKTVIDFTSMTEEELKKYFLNQESKLCGRFRPDQLGSYPLYATFSRPSKSTFLKTGLASLLIFLSNIPDTLSSAPSTKPKVYQKESSEIKEVKISNQDRIISGIVVDEDKVPLPGVCINLKNQSIGTFTDIEGRFTFPEPVDMDDILVFSFVGMVTKEVVIDEKAFDKLKVFMLMMDMDVLGEVSVDQVYEIKKKSLWNKTWEGLTQWF